MSSLPDTTFLCLMEDAARFGGVATVKRDLFHRLCDLAGREEEKTDSGASHVWLPSQALLNLVEKAREGLK